MTELVINSTAVVVQPGDKILLIVPRDTSMHELQHLSRKVKEWAPEADWILIAGVEAVYKKRANDQI